MRFILLIALLLTACGKSSVVDPEFKPYYDAFLAEAASYGVEINKEVSIEFGDLPSALKGECNKEEQRVTINKSYWNYDMPAEDKEVMRTYLIFHELGHCLLDKSHDNREINGEAALMHTEHETRARSKKVLRVQIEGLFKH